MKRRALLALAAGGALQWPSRAAQAVELPALIAGARPSVLPVGTFSATDNPRFGFRGSGFVVGDGLLVVTNFHVLPPAAGAEGGPQMVVMTGRSEAALRRATVVATDRLHDLAVLRLEGAPLPALPLAEAGTAREGQAVLLMGYPIAGVLGFAPVSHAGIVSSLVSAGLPAPSAAQLDARAVAQLRQGAFELLQLDAVAYPGNSGGPLLEQAGGRVIGIVNMGLVKGSRESALSSPTGISYAVPVQYLHALLREIR